MQTFLPYSSFSESAKCLDRARLNKQILEGRQIVSCLHKKQLGTAKGWANHPAVLMWEGHKSALFAYTLAMSHRYRLNTGKRHKAFDNLYKEHGDWCLSDDEFFDPPWLGVEAIHSSHRGRLLHKGTIDVIRKRVNKIYKATKPWTTFTVEDVKLVCLFLKCDYDEVVESSHYAQFGWTELPSDTYIWPRDLELAS